MHKFLITLAVVVAPAMASAQYTYPQASQKAIATVNLGAINTIKYTGWQRVDQFHCISYQLNYTWNAATFVNFSCQSSSSTGTTNGQGYNLNAVVSTDAATGKSTTITNTLTEAVSASAKWNWTVCNPPDLYLNCSFLTTGGNASDTGSVIIRGLN